MVGRKTPPPNHTPALDPARIPCCFSFRSDGDGRREQEFGAGPFTLQLELPGFVTFFVGKEVSID